MANRRFASPPSTATCSCSRQKLMTFSEKYVVWDDEEQPVLFIERPAYVGRQLLAMAGTIGAFLVTFALAMFVILGLSGNGPLSGLVGGLFAVLLVLCFVLPVVVFVVLSPKRHIFFYADESKGEALAPGAAGPEVPLVVATYTVLDPEGTCLGRMKKNYLYNFFRKRWDVRDADDTRLLLIAREDSLLLSLLRPGARVLHGIPPHEFHPGRAPRR